MAGVVDLGYGWPEVVGDRVGGGDGVRVGLYGGVTVAAGGADLLLDAPADHGSRSLAARAA
jgi:hypothetical protein